MRHFTYKRMGILIVTAFVAVVDGWAANPRADKYTDWSTEKELFVLMRDGVRLSTDVLLPKGAAGTLPTVLVRTPYDKDKGEITVVLKWLELYVKQGYAVVLQNERGRYLSEGEYNNFRQGASTDGYDTVDWIVKQPWSNGKVGTLGCSASGGQQWPLASASHPGHTAMIPGASGSGVGNVPGNDTRGIFYRGGVPMSGWWASWYSNHGATERMILPPNAPQEERIRIRNSYALDPKSGFDSAALPLNFMYLPNKDVLRHLGGPLTPFDKYISWTPADPRWNDVELLGAGAKPRVPALHVSTWHDYGVGETTRLFKYLQDLEIPNQYLIIGAGPHCSFMSEGVSDLTGSGLADLFADAGVTSIKGSDLKSVSNMKLAKLKFGDLEIGDARYGADDYGYTKLFLNWFGYWLNGEHNHITEMPRVQLYVMGMGWLSGDRWPLRETRLTNYYLSEATTDRPLKETHLLSVRPSNRNESDRYVYDPSVPTPSRGGGCCDATAALDQRPIEARKDVLVYSTPPLEKPLTIAGPIQVVLYVSSSARDTDFMVKLVDVYPDGKAINLSDDAFRMRYREGFDKKVLMEAGGIYQVTLSNMVAAVRFPKGHRLRLDVTSSNFPLYERNLNTGGNNYDETRWEVAENSIHHGPRYPSHLVLPVLPIQDR
jgi:putative CocE/NonD family hydrolase